MALPRRRTGCARRSAPRGCDSDRTCSRAARSTCGSSGERHRRDATRPRAAQEAGGGVTTPTAQREHARERRACAGRAYHGGMTGGDRTGDAATGARGGVAPTTRLQKSTAARKASPRARLQGPRVMTPHRDSPSREEATTTQRGRATTSTLPPCAFFFCPRRYKTTMLTLDDTRRQRSHSRHGLLLERLPHEPVPVLRKKEGSERRKTRACRRARARERWSRGREAVPEGRAVGRSVARLRRGEAMVVASSWPLCRFRQTTRV